MRITVKFRGLAQSAALRVHTERRLRFHLTRFGPEVGSVEVRLSDVNGEKGGLDKRCHVTLKGPRLGSLTIEELRADLHSAIDVATDRAHRSVARQIARRHTRRLAQRPGLHLD
jgi:ribosome-associated translation inhibitor RaiA